MKPLKSRAIRRIIKKEQEKISTWYHWVCKRFYSDLFDDHLHVDYRTILSESARSNLAAGNLKS